MLCTKPITIARKLFACGQCTPCRVNRRRKWCHRLMLEHKKHASSSFATLTYDDDHLPVNAKGLPSLDPKALTLFLKRFRYYSGIPVRYFAVGEYGDETMRPHYHAILFGAAACQNGMTTRTGRAKRCCPSCDTLDKAWPLGLTHQGDVTPHSIQYTCGYTLKKMTNADDGRLQGRSPEFARMSRNPGLGFSALEDIANTLKRYRLDVTESDVPSALMHGGSPYPLDNYTKRKLRLELGKDEKAPEAVLQVIEAEVQALRQIAEDTGSTLTEVLRQTRSVKADAYERKQRSFQKRKTL